MIKWLKIVTGPMVCLFSLWAGLTGLDINHHWFNDGLIAWPLFVTIFFGCFFGMIGGWIVGFWLVVSGCETKSGKPEKKKPWVPIIP